MNRLWFCGIAFLAVGGCVSAQSSSSGLLRQADAAYRAKEISKAVELFEKALDADPSLAPAHMMLGIIYAQQNQAGKAAEQFDATVNIQPQNAAAHFYLARLASSGQDWPKAATHYTAALENGHPDRDGAAIGLAVAEAHIGQAAGALARLRALRPAAGEQSAPYYDALALAYRHLDHPGDAAEALRKAVMASPEDPTLREKLSGVLIALGEYAPALTEAIQAQRIFPDHAGIQYQLGIGGFYIPGSPFTSLALRNLTDLAPGDSRTLVLKGLARLGSEEPGVAVELLRQAAAANGPQARLFLAMALTEREEFSEAREVLLRVGDDALDGNFYLVLGRVLIGQERYPEALGPLGKALTYMPSRPEVHLQLSRVYERTGDTAKAAEHRRNWERLRSATGEGH